VPLVKKRFLLAFVSFLYSLLFRFAIDPDIAFDILVLFADDGLVSGRDMDNLSGLFYIILALGIIGLIIFYFEKIRKSFIFIYLPSLLAFFLVPFRSRGFIRFGWGFDAIISVIINLIAGPAMIMLVTYFAIKLFKARAQKR